MLNKTLIAGATALSLLTYGTLQTEDKPLTGPEVKTMVQNLGFEVKDLNTETGKEKIEFMVQRDGFDVWLASEVSGSKRFIWITAFLGDSTKIANFSARAPKMLEQNYKIQPSQFYVTDKGSLYMAIAVDNRNVTPAALRWRIDKLASDVTSSAELWKP